MISMDENCLELDLGLGLSKNWPKRDNQSKHDKRRVLLDLSISHPPCSHAMNLSSDLKMNVGEEETRRIKKMISNCSKEEDDTNFYDNCSRKKLRLTRDQTILLEDSFKQHCTLNMAQKQALAQQLNLKPRQVEVWFQNRRARTKLKQTELSCQFLKKNCEKLNEENKRLKKELFDLQSSVNTHKITPPLPIFYQFPEAAAAVLRKCQSCEKTDKARGGSGGKQDSAAAAGGEVVREG